MSVTKLVLNSATTVHEIIQMLDKSGVGILPVVDVDQRLVGIVTDGDVRRAILQNSLDIDHIINKNPKRVSNKTAKGEILRLLRQMHLRHMPIVDEQGRLVDVVFLENLMVEPKANKVVIMAGGLGSRLGALTQETPKPMLPVRGRPILEHIIENLKFQGFTQFVLCLNYKAEVIQNHFKNGEKLNVNIEYTKEEKRLGTAGALSLIDRKSIEDPFIVLNADIITNIDFEDVLNFHAGQQSHATMCIKPQAYEIPYACVEFDEYFNLKSLVEKPKVNNYINAGIYTLNPEILEEVPAGEFYDMPSLFQDLIKKEFTTKIYRFEDYWIDIGLPTDYSKANSEIN
ncbi:MAG TPA: nucleotidyltransferase family protein [Ohtaekwangia sp.]|uniref:nucleotidyltransferase family protein n=1 Tax=Ohtaekwangia sp. TaxID=2066019 RepID=UPI002F920410